MSPSAMLLSLWRSATNNLGLKVTALVAAVVVFYLVQGEQDAQRVIFVDVVSLMPAPDAAMMLVSSLPDQVKVTLRGSSSRINALSRDDFDPVQMNLSDTSRRYFYFDPSAIEVPLGVSIVQIEPATVQLSWTEVAERQVPIRAYLMGQPRDGLQVKQPVLVVPPRVTIHGPAIEVQTITEVETDAIVLDGLPVGSHIRRIPLEHQPGHVSYVDDFEVQVRIDIAPEMAERSLARLEVAALGNGEFIVRPAAVDVLLRGPARALAALSGEHVVPFVDLQEMEAGAGNQTAKVQLRGLPEGVQAARISPPDVLVRRRR